MTKKPKFRVVDSHKYLRLGKRDKRKRKYKRPRGGENKIRLNRAGRLRKVKVGFKNKLSERGLIKNLRPVMVYNISDIKKINNGMIGVVAKIGDKKKKEIAEYTLKNKIQLLNLEPDKFLKALEEKIQKSKELKTEKEKIKEKKEKEEKQKIEVKETEKHDVEKTEKKEVEEKEKLEDKLEGKVEEEKNKETKEKEIEKQSKEEDE